MQQYAQMGRDAFHAGADRLGPLSMLMAGGGAAAVDAWYEGYDDACGHGPYYGTTAQALRDAYVPKGLPSKLRDAA